MLGDGIITPASQLYIRNNVVPPDPSIVKDRDAWKVSIEEVKAPRELTLGELKTMGLATLAMVLQCSGNGRKFFPHKPSGTPWNTGAAGCVMWTGLPVAQLVEALGGIAEGAHHMTGRGGETLPAGIDANTVIVERSVPLAAMQDALLAWEMNGEPISLAHGGPLRLIVPGYSGVNNVKYIKRLAFTPEQTQAAIQNVHYRIAPVGTKETPQQPAVWRMDVKSWINGVESAGTLPAAASHAATVGPSLDELKPDAARVEAVLRKGMGVMPAYGTLGEEDIKALSTYVSQAAGGA